MLAGWDCRQSQAVCPGIAPLCLLGGASSRGPLAPDLGTQQPLASACRYALLALACWEFRHRGAARAVQLMALNTELNPSDPAVVQARF